MDNFMNQEEIDELFRKVDVQNDGYITTKKIIVFMESQGEHLKELYAQMMLRKVSSSSISRMDVTESHQTMGSMQKDTLFCIGAIHSSSVHENQN